MTLLDKFTKTRREMAAGLIERDDEVDALLTALLAKEHCLLVGPPGTAKSHTLDGLLRWTGGVKFGWQLNKFTMPEEVFGPVSVAGLKADRYIRITTGKLPEADFAFLDEIFKASSAILNTLLRVLNERTYDAGDGVSRKVPLKLCVAASNEWPSTENGKELGALFDRFVIRRTVRTIATAAGRERLLYAADSEITPEISTKITPAEIDAASYEALGLPFSDAGKAALGEVLRELAKEGVQPGDRRMRKAVKVARAFAWLSAAEAVQPDHLEILAAVLWDDPQEQPAVCNRVIAKIANPVGMRINSALLEVEQILAGADLRKLDQAAKAAAQLAEIDRTLAACVGGNGRVAKARTYLQGQLKALKLKSIEAI